MRIRRQPTLRDSKANGSATSTPLAPTIQPANYADAKHDKSVSAVLSVAVHVIVIAAVLMFSGVSRTAPARQALTTFNVNDSGKEPSRPEAPQPKPVPPQPPLPIVIPPPAILIPHETDIVATLLKQADLQKSAGGCDLTAPVQAALQTSPEVQLQLPAIPVERRSVANAIAVWNQAWIEPDAAIDQEVYDTIRSTIANTISRASESCRLQAQGGPRLIYIPVEGTTTVIALGSGEWTWQQLVDSAQPQFAMLGNEPLLAQRASLELSDMIATLIRSPLTESSKPITAKHAQMRPGI